MATIALSAEAKTARAQAFIDLADSLPEAATLKVYSDPQPGSADDAPDVAATLLATINCPKPFAPDAVAGVIISNVFDQAMANGGSGLATWARLELDDGTPLGDFTVGLEGSGANIEMANNNILPGVLLQLQTFQLSEA
jgi:hypothetical protein